MMLFGRGSKLITSAWILAAVYGFQGAAIAASISFQVFATGSAVGATAPDSVTYGNGFVWVEYGNGAASTDFSGNSTIVQYDLKGSVVKQYTIPGSVDGLKYNPNTGQVWALQNQDANSQLTIIDPSSGTTSSYAYGAPYTSVSGSRGLDDVAFIGNKVYLSVTNPASPADPVLVSLNSATPASPLTFSAVLSQGTLLLTDPDSLKSTPTGGLVQTGEGDGALTFINNPGLASQTATSLKLSAAPGAIIGKPDDSIYATASAGTFYIADTGANVVYAVTANGLPLNSLYVSAGNVFGSVDPVTGVLTPLINGTSLHGADFVAAPEPSTWGLTLAGLGLAVAVVIRKRQPDPRLRRL